MPFVRKPDHPAPAGRHFESNPAKTSERYGSPAPPAPSLKQALPGCPVQAGWSDPGTGTDYPGKDIEDCRRVGGTTATQDPGNQRPLRESAWGAFSARRVEPTGRSGARRSQEVPSVASNVDEDSDASVGLIAWLSDELNTAPGHPAVRFLEVIYAKEETDSSRILRSNGVVLVFAIGLR